MGLLFKALAAVFLVLVLVGVGVGVTSMNQNKNLLSGQVKGLSQDLGLVILSEDETLNNYKAKTHYYEAGKFEKGELAGYTRIVLIREATSPAGAVRMVLATKDYKTYIVDKSDELKVDNYFVTLNQSKVTTSKIIPSNHPQVISLDEKFSLNKNEIYSSSLSDGEGEVLKIDISDLVLLGSSGDLKYYTHESDTSTDVVVIDQTGLAYHYDLTNKIDVDSYLVRYNKYQEDLKKYFDWQKNKIGTEVEYPSYPTRPSLRFTSDQVSINDSTYKKYDVAFPASCATDVNTAVVKNVTDSDFRKIGTSPDGDIFALVDKDNKIYHDQFDAKITIISDELWKYANNPPKPTFAEYVAKNPLLFFKDYWGRWVAVGEYDFMLAGGCGKPVIYLYPEKEIEVSIHFLSRMQLTTTIPSYVNGWNVVARPDGSLSEVTLKTDCSLIPVKFGTEYAKDACKNNLYPYLFWAGNSLERNYPKITKGWVVAKGEINNFLGTKLDEVGFSQKEKSDALEYWLVEMNKVSAPFYRISFLQTPEMNNIAPMVIYPQPQSLFRLFLDFSPLSEKPTNIIQPQNLVKIQRNGFSVIEWGTKLLK